ncbi:MAG: nucleotidyltransferase domain-containing protein [Verrucomicrobia bacterium]|nr:nucleotidyltransferase domain-containing protein [Verrucomicrobiota bacterium]
MKTREDVLIQLATAKRELQEEFKVRSLALFGSYARNEQSPTSDVDVLVRTRQEVDRVQHLQGSLTQAVLRSGRKLYG